MLTMLKRILPLALFATLLVGTEYPCKLTAL